MAKKILKLTSIFGVAVFLCLQIKAEESSANLKGIVWDCELLNFSRLEYERVVERLFAAYEEKKGERLAPAGKKRVGLKLYTHSGLGLSTPRALVEAIIKTLERRGFGADDVFLIDTRDRHLRKSLYLPPISRKSTLFKGRYVVYSEERGGYSHEKWYYNSPLPPRYHVNSEKDRLLSYLPYPLLWDVDFWINLPMVVDHPVLGISGALANATLLNITNSDRFLLNPNNAASALAEIAAIPELNRTWVFTIMTLERYQYIGGVEFNSLYTKSEKKVFLSSNPVALDYIMYKKLNSDRKEKGFPLILPMPMFFHYAEILGVGEYASKQVDRILLK